MSRVALVAVLLLLAACAQVSESPLQRYDALRPSLRSATELARAVSSDVHQLNLGMKHDNRRWIARVAARLQTSAMRLGRVTMTLHSRVRAIRRDDDAGDVRRYFRLILRTLSKQRYEALWAGRLARTIRRDPLLLSPRNVAAARQQSRMAARSAASSVRSAIAARGLEAENRASFRYVSVSPGSTNS